ncbi:peptide ABC transporter permease [Lacrimispora amygdalina]|uniref:ABC transporter permease n=1 Tax=Lacrimispora amygdalina TaxID=253257 RepID=A0A3E2ND80_9FIRM|nr:ABC transporter permease [Clostridium indicum]RFZ78968.1 ABC transporter permease [Clostridium indicum]
MIRQTKIWKSLSGSGKVSIVLLLLIVSFTVGYHLFGSETYRQPSGSSLEAPGLRHMMGTDDLGIDIAAQIGHGAGVSLLVGISSALLAGLGGSILGILAGYYRGWKDKLVMGLCDVVMTMPQMPLLIVLGAFFGSSTRNIILVIGFMSWAGPARIVRSRMLSMGKEAYVAAARSYGAGFFHLLMKHFIPGLYPLILVSMIRIVGHAIVAEAGLSFLGLGDPVSKSWGVILNRSINFPGIFFVESWKWWVLFPLVFLLVLVVSFAFLGRDLEKIMNTK